MKIIVIITIAILICSCKENYHISERLSVVDLGKCTQEAVDSPTFLIGDGSAGDPYIICNINQLQLVNSGLTDHYQLGKNIDATITSTWTTGTTGNGFIPIGGCNADYSNCRAGGDKFQGSFDGCEYTISNLFINRSRGAVGLFGAVGAGAVITNFKVTNANITGDDDVGGIVARLYNNLTNAYFSGTVSGVDETGGIAGFSSGNINSVTANINVSCSSFNCGGGVGRNSGNITEVITSGSVTSITSIVGGLVGRAVTGSVITRSKSSATVNGTNATGGLVGYNYYGSILSSSASGNVTGTFNTGGLAGDTYQGTIEDSYATGGISGTTRVGGAVGFVQYGDIERSFATGTVNGTSSSVGAFAGNFSSSPTVRDSFATGVVTSSGLGGFVGTDGGSPPTNSHHNTSVSTFYNLAHPVYASAAPAWDFTTIWFSPAPGTLPLLR